MLKCSSQIEHNNFNTLIWQKSIYKAWHYNKTRYTGSKHIWICTILATRAWKGIFVSRATPADELAAWLMKQTRTTSMLLISSVVERVWTLRNHSSWNGVLAGSCRGAHFSRRDGWSNLMLMASQVTPHFFLSPCSQTKDGVWH